MNLQRSIFWLILVVLLLLMLVLWHKREQQRLPVVAITTNAAPSGLIPVTTPIQAVKTPAPAGLSTNPRNVPVSDKGEQIKEGLAGMNDVPIVFYGRLEDQFGNPVAEAQIAVSVRVYNSFQSTAEHSTVISDENGLFQIQGGKGESLGIMPKKDGYALATTSTYYKYSYMYPDHFTPDQGNPTVIKMWKLQGAEPLASITKTYKIYYTNAPINFDLLTGQVVPTGGDLQIIVNRPDGVISQQHPQNWNIQVNVVNGGLIETSFEESRVTYSAPGGGYQPANVFGNNNGPDLIDKMFFMQSRNGQVYSKFHFLFGINDSPDGMMSVTFNGVANTNGSGNWEATAPQ